MTLPHDRYRHQTLKLVSLLLVLCAPALAQTPNPADPATPRPENTGGPAGLGKPFVDLTNRYRFIEHYTTHEEQARPGLVGQYHVAIQEVIRESLDTPEGRVKPTEVARQTIFSERPAEVTSLGLVTATIRSYQRFQVHPDESSMPPGPAPLDGLTVWFRPQINAKPVILSLTADRRLTDREYDIAARQVFMPNLATLLPASPVRVGDSWRIARKTLQAMVGDPDLRADAFVGKFLELRRDEDAKTTHALMSIVGRVGSSATEITINAQVRFTFATPGAQPNGDPTQTTGLLGQSRPVDETLIDAHGAITELRLARNTTGTVPGNAVKAQRYRRLQEVVLERKLGADPQTGLLKLFEAPAISDVNSWLTYASPQGRFVFQHPQDLLPADRTDFGAKPATNPVFLTKTRPDGRDLVRIEVFDKEQTPETLKDLLNNQWKQMKLEILPGNEEWLPEAEWPNMKVFRIEAALKVPARGGRGSRMHYDAYLVKIGKNDSLFVVATTNREAVTAFRRDVEQMIKTFRRVPATDQ